MVEKMVKVLFENYKRYLLFTPFAFAISVCLRLIFNFNHVVIASLLFAFALVCSYWFLDTKQSFNNVTPKTNFIITFKLIIIFVLILFGVSFLSDFCFGFTAGFATTCSIFFTNILLQIVSRKLFK